MNKEKTQMATQKKNQDCQNLKKFLSWNPKKISGDTLKITFQCADKTPSMFESLSLTIFFL